MTVEGTRKGVQPADWNMVNAGERRQALAHIFLERAQTKMVAEAIGVIRSDGLAGAETSALILLGERGLGKTTFLERIRDMPDNQPRTVVLEDRQFVRHPVVCVSFPSSPTLRSAAKQLLASLLAPSPELVQETAASLRGTRDAFTDRAIALLKQKKVELLLCDEVQRVSDRDGGGEGAVAEWLAQVLKDSRVPTVLAGLPELEKILDVVDGLVGLSPECYSLMPYPYNSTRDREAYRKFVTRLAGRLPFNQVGDLVKADTVDGLWLATRGYMRPLAHIIRRAARMAMTEDAHGIERTHLLQAVNALSKLKVNIGYNPFGADRKRVVSALEHLTAGNPGAA